MNFNQTESQESCSLSDEIENAQMPSGIKSQEILMQIHQDANRFAACHNDDYQTSTSISENQIKNGHYSEYINNIIKSNTKFYIADLKFFRKMIQENYLWATQTQNSFLLTKIVAFLNGFSNVQSYIRDMQIDQHLSVSKLLPVLQRALELWHIIRCNRKVSIDQFLELIATVITNAQSLATVSSIQESVPESHVEMQVEEVPQDNPRVRELEEEIEKAKEKNARLEQQLLEEANKRKQDTSVGNLQNAMCPVCYESFRNFDLKQIKILPCGHMLCNNCRFSIFDLRKSENHKCPVCRNEFMKKNVITLYPSFDEL